MIHCQNVSLRCSVERDRSGRDLPNFAISQYVMEFFLNYSTIFPPQILIFHKSCASFQKNISG